MTKSIPTLLAGFLSCLFLLAACGEDRRVEYEDRTNTNSWIYQTMSRNYLYADQLKSESSTNAYATPENYIEGLILSAESRGGKSVSALFYGTEKEALSYGLQYAYQRYDSIQCLRVLYVAPSSPAAEAGLKRGDWIVGLDGYEISSRNQQVLTETDEPIGHTLSLARYMDTLYAGEPILEADRTVTLPAPRKIDSSPVEKDTLIETGGKKIGYLLYTGHTAFTGINSDGQENEADELKAALKRMADGGATELVIDLRASNGISLEMARQMATLIAPQEAYGQLFYYLLRNEQREQDIHPITPPGSGTGEALCLKQVAFLTSTHTAGTGELLAHCLAPYMKTVVVGEKTTGLDLLTETYYNKEYGYGIRLATTQIANARLETYSSGLTPDYPIAEGDSLLPHMLPLGNPNELLLKKAIRTLLYPFDDKDGVTLPESENEP